MLEKVDLDLNLSKKKYKQIFEPLQLRLGDVQRRAHEAGLPVVVLFEGWEAAGKGTCINRLVQRLDPRGFKVHPVSSPTDSERLHPFLWRFAVNMPLRGRIAIFDRSWYGRVLVERVEGLVPERKWRASYEQVLKFERQLTDDGAVIVKFWLHISKKEQARRFKAIAADPSLSWKVGETELAEHRQYSKYQAAVEEMLERTSTANAPWTIVEASDGRFAQVKVIETLLDAFTQALERVKPAEDRRPMVGDVAGVTSADTLLDRVDLSLALKKKAYQKALDPMQQRLRQLEHELFRHRRPAVVVYEGWDAAGKGGNIKRLTGELDPRGYEVIPVAAPSTEELGHHYLWRFWKQLPKGGHLTIFDRSWYGRVMVERIEGFCTVEQWQRAFQEINEFEQMLAAHGTIIVKFWIHISREEQLRRFEERKDNPDKQWKLTEEDWRNREKWPLYRQAVVEMIQRTSTTYAPWTIISGDDKYHARIQALSTVVAAIEAGLKT